MEPNESDIAIRAGVASFVLAAGAATATFLANRREETQTLATVGSALALAASAFAMLGLRAVRNGVPAPGAAARSADGPNAGEIVRATDLLQGIARIAQAGTFADQQAIEVAFALISRQANEASDLLGRIESGTGGVLET